MINHLGSLVHNQEDHSVQSINNQRAAGLNPSQSLTKNKSFVIGVNQKTRNASSRKNSAFNQGIRFMVFTTRRLSTSGDIYRPHRQCLGSVYKIGQVVSPRITTATLPQTSSRRRACNEPQHAAGGVGGSATAAVVAAAAAVTAATLRQRFSAWVRRWRRLSQRRNGVA